MTTQPDLSILKGLIVDMDGVLWRGETSLPGFAPFFELLERKQIPFMLATNNATKTQDQYVQKFAKLGVSISPHQVMTSSLATAEFLTTQYPAGTRIHVVGQDGIRQAITSAGFEIADSEVAAVVVGLDFEMTYDKLRRAAILINRGARFIGTNPDLTFPFEDGIAPGNGAILAAISAGTGQTPTIIGKPEKIIFELALKHLGVPAGQAAMVGDRLETDIVGAQKTGLRTVLVLSGVTQADEVADSSIKPDWVFSGIDALVSAWP